MRLLHHILDSIDQCTVYTLGQDARETEGTRENKNLREAKDRVELMDTVMAENMRQKQGM